MLAKCSLSSYNPVLQLLGLLFMAIILVTVVIYYLQVYHSSILEKYADAASGAVNPASIRYHAFTANAAAATDQTIYAGANISADKSNSFTLRDCKVYFTDDIDGCDKIQDTPTKTCSYKLDGWNEFDTYTDKDGGAITYGKKIYKPDATGTLLNAHLNSKCFKEFDGGGARGFEYINNPLVVYSAKGITDNGVEDANTFGGKKYTSIQFINATDAGDNLTKVIDSICSVKYDAISALTGKVFYKFIFDTNKNITAIQKVRFNDNQTGIEKVQENALTDFASKGSRGLRFDNNGRLQVFVNEAAINASMNIFKFNYLTNICANAQIKDYRIHASQNVNITNFVSFNIRSGASKEQIIDIRNLHLIEQEAKNRFSRKDGNINVNYNKELLEYIERKKQGIIKFLTDASKTNKDKYSDNIRDRQREQREATERKNNFKNQSFADIIGLTFNNQRLFDYARGYKNNVLDTIPIPREAEAYLVNSKDICLIFKNNEQQNQKSYTFTVPEGKNYVCDILMVGGGGGGGDPHGGGGGAGQLVLIRQATLNGTYTIKVGNGGTGGVYEGSPPTKGSDSVFSNSSITVIAEGGGANTNNAIDKNGGSGAGGDAYNPGGGTSGAGTKNTTVDLFSGATVYSIGNNGGIQGGAELRGGGGGGAGEQGQSGTFTIPGKGGDGLSGIAEINYDFQTNFGNFGKLEADGKYYFAGGGGGGNASGLNNSKGGGGNGGYGGYPSTLGGNGVANTGSGGGGGGGGGNATGGIGGSGIVIIRIKNIISAPTITLTTTDNYYKLPPAMPITILSSRIQSSILTSFVYLQAGFYRFRADIGINDAVNQNSNIIYAELVIYDESNLSGSQYNCKTVFKYKRYDTRNMPSYLRQYIQIPTNKFYKLAYTYYYFNNTTGNIDDNFNIYCKYLNTTSQILEGSVFLTNPANNDSQFAKDNIAEISTSLNQYLFSGINIHTAYNNDTLKSLFSTISYYNNNSEALRAYLDTGGKINNAPIDYFKLNFLDTKITEEQSKYDSENNLLTTAINNNPTIANYTMLYNDINNINYTSLIPVDNLTLKTGTSFVSIFGEGKENSYITFDKVSNTNNLSNPTLTPTVFVEAI
jgi:hypothetical protein